MQLISLLKKTQSNFSNLKLKGVWKDGLRSFFSLHTKQQNMTWKLFSQTDLVVKISKIFPFHTANTETILFENIITKVLQKKLTKNLSDIINSQRRRMLMMQLHVTHMTTLLEINHLPLEEMSPVKVKMAYLTSFLFSGERIIYRYITTSERG